MSEFKGTPGPWEVNANTSVESESGGFICEAYGDSTSWEEDQANADLIAAAPELLYALQGAEKALFAALDNVFGEELANGNRELIQARAAIAKALGESK